MTVIQDFEDNKGRYPLVFKGYKNLQEVHDYLWNNFQGYHFCVIFDVTKDEYEPFEKALYVYFSDEALLEIAEYSGKKVVPK